MRPRQSPQAFSSSPSSIETSGKRSASERVEVDHLRGVERAALAGKVVRAVAKDLARGRVERDRDPLAVPGSLGRLEDRLDRRRGRLEVRREAALVADAGREPALVEHGLQRVEDLGADAERLGEGLGAGGDDHELLEVEPVLGVRAAVDDVHERHRQRPRAVAAEPAVQRSARVCGGRLRGGERAAEDRVRTEPALVRRSVELDQQVVERALIVRVDAGERARDLAVDVRDRFQHALAEVRRGVAVAQLDGLVLAGRRPGRDGRAPERARVEADVDLERRIAPRVEELSRVDVGDCAHASLSFARS